MKTKKQNTKRITLDGILGYDTTSSPQTMKKSSLGFRTEIV